MEVTVTVNGADYTRDVEPRMLLSDFIRTRLGLTGTHVGCDTTNTSARSHSSTSASRVWCVPMSRLTAVVSYGA